MQKRRMARRVSGRRRLEAERERPLIFPSKPLRTPIETPSKPVVTSRSHHAHITLATRLQLATRPQQAEWGGVPGGFSAVRPLPAEGQGDQADDAGVGFAYSTYLSGHNSLNFRPP